MAILDPIKKAVSSAVRKAATPLRPANIAGPLRTGGQDRFGELSARVAAETAQRKRVAAHEDWRQHGSRKGIWTTYVAFSQLASGAWIPVHSSNVSAIKWMPLNPFGMLGAGSSQDVLANRAVPPERHRANPNPMELTRRGHGGDIWINGRFFSARDTARIRELLTPAEFRAYQNRMLEPQEPAMEINTGKVEAGLFGSKVRNGPMTARITEETPGALFVRYHRPARVYLYPGMALGEVLDMYQAPSKGRFVWDALRWSGRPYQQISGPPVKFRMGEGR